MLTWRSQVLLYSCNASIEPPVQRIEAPLHIYAESTVTQATLRSIAVTPASPTIAKGATQQFTATGTYSDGSTHNLTTSVVWTSATPTVATIVAGGLATGVGQGTSNITARFRERNSSTARNKSSSGDPKVTSPSREGPDGWGKRG
jgi:uncharacterized protein YjdB